MHRLQLEDSWPLWLGAIALTALLWPAQRTRELLPWVLLGAALTSLLGGVFRPTLAWPLLDQWAGTRLWIKGPLLLLGAFSLGVGLRLCRGRPSWISTLTGLLVGLVLVAIGRAVFL
jgi:hypothetical protein